MKKAIQKRFLAAAAFLGAFALWTAAVCFVDVQTIGPRGSSVGFGALNRFVHELTGVNMTLYTITDWLGLVPVAVGFGFGIVGLVQWIQRRRIWKVDADILLLGVFYIIVMAAYLFFESWVVNYRPVLIAGYLEASYPSSTTLLVMCVMPTAIVQFRSRIKHSSWKATVTAVTAAFVAFMVIGRILSGVHWISDIIGGGLLSVGLVLLYDACCRLTK